jgi:PIN domain nuclease of toxin-antitoxin system
MPTLLDTHAWVWWVTGDRRLSQSAGKAIEAAQAGEALWLSPISIWEVAKKVEKGQLILDRPVADWLDLASLQPGLQMTDLSSAILVESCRLPQPFHGDPVDQIIVATARDRDATIVTKTQAIRGYAYVRSLW